MEGRSCVRKCSVKSCEKDLGNSVLHKLPKDHEVAKVWKTFLMQKNHDQLLPPVPMICSQHFKEEDYYNFTRYKMGQCSRLLLKQGALPTVNEIAANETMEGRPCFHKCSVKSNVKDQGIYKCSVKSCVKDQGNSVLHKLPKDHEVAKVWKTFLMQKNHDQLLPPIPMICSQHFKEGDYHNFTRYKMGQCSRLLLKQGALPTVNEIATNETMEGRPCFRKCSVKSSVKDQGIRKCSVKSCVKDQGKLENSVLHYLPKDHEVAKVWKTFLMQKNHDQLLPPIPMVCSQHFKEEDYHNFTSYLMGYCSRLLLKQGALPTLHKITTNE
ncbi:unnamed protein product, partial [Meganyctiphanes norvegica]